MDVVSIKHLNKIYRIGSSDLFALRGLELVIGEGEYVAIMGPSGSGKSTLLNILGCLDRPTNGIYELVGHNVSKLNDNELSSIRGREIGFVFQSYNLIAQLNVIENIEIPMYYQGVSGHESAARAKKLAEMVGLSKRLYHRPSELSGGQQQRVAIARALANDPKIILADEPTGNLDSHSGHEILMLLDRLHEQGKTIIIVTHDPGIGERAERVVRLLDGEIVVDMYNAHRQS